MRTHNLRVFFGSHLHYHTQSGSGSGSGKGGSKSGKSSKGSGSGKGGSGKGGSKSSKSSGKVRVIYVASVDDDPTLLSSSIYIRKSNPNPIHVQYSIVSFLQGSGKGGSGKGGSGKGGSKGGSGSSMKKSYSS